MSEYSKLVAELVDWKEYYEKIDREEYFKEELKKLDECNQMFRKHLHEVTDKIKPLTDEMLLSATPKSLKALREDLAAWKNWGLKGEPRPADYVKKIDKILLEHTEGYVIPK